MLDIRFVRENPELVKENIRKKFQNAKLPLVDEAIALDAEKRSAMQENDALKAERNKLSKANGPLYGQLKKCDDEAKKTELQAQIDANNAAVKANADRMAQLDARINDVTEQLNKIMMVIPQIIDPSVGLVEKPAEPPPVQETVPEKPAEPPPPPKKTMRELKAEADAAQRALDVEIAKARVLNRGKELPSFAGIRFGEVMKGPARTPEAIVSGTETNVSGYVRRMAGPKLKAPFRKFDNPPIVYVTPQSHRIFRIEFTQAIPRKPGLALNPETTNLVEILSGKLKFQPFALDFEKYPMGDREFVFPMDKTTLTVGEYGGEKLRLTVEHEEFRTLAKSETEAFRAEALKQSSLTEPPYSSANVLLYCL